MAVRQPRESVGRGLDLRPFVAEAVAQRAQEGPPFVAFEHAVRRQRRVGGGGDHGGSQDRDFGGQMRADGDADSVEREYDGRGRHGASVGQPLNSVGVHDHQQNQILVMGGARRTAEQENRQNLRGRQDRQAAGDRLAHGGVRLPGEQAHGEQHPRRDDEEVQQRGDRHRVRRQKPVGDEKEVVNDDQRPAVGHEPLRSAFSPSFFVALLEPAGEGEPLLAARHEGLDRLERYGNCLHHPAFMCE